MDMDDEETTEKYILENFKVIAVVGCSRNVGKPSHDVPEYLQQHGYRIIPVNPFADEILGEKAYKSLLDLSGSKIDVVDVFRPAGEALQIARDAVAIGAKALWLQEGIISEDAQKFAAAHGLRFVMNRCMMKEHYRLIDKV
ncbi:MAG: CoA-binding protein [Candidatus Micrarchaeales archaeon]|jgi:Predicted CoA-binding protein|uniref:CoA-binding domain protein n=1 Tax=Candidatus Micrarchaeum acidiphilum ARMAN-2 TaxID=425595 RepID=C7DHS6_MICA2|nr:MAG: CoA-binding domain protein [Candidatus Micrarchaeum acidiphilum ARMAN-2]MCW6160747.1 CoA-binding protein [Candidatus Micrarchaeales archaeon]